MEIIIEYIIIDNLVINFLILFISCKILKNKIIFWRLAFSSVLGAIVSLILPILILPTFALIILKLILGIIMTLISLPSQTFKKVLVSFLTFVAMTGVMGGICFLIIFLVSDSFNFDILITYSSEISIGIILFICSLTTYFIIQLIKIFYRRKNINNFVYETIFLNNGRTVKINSYLDSGNTLIDPETNKPVIIIDYSLFEKLCCLPLEKILTKKIKSEVKNPHYILFNTVGKKSEMFVFQVESMKIFVDNKKSMEFKDVSLGLSFSKLNKTFCCNALLPASFICN